MEKECKQCGMSFVASGRNTSRMVYCSEKCRTKASNKRFSVKNPDAILKSRATYSSNWERKTLSSLKYRAKKEGLPFNIDESDIQLIDTCPILGIKLVRVFGTSGKVVGYRPDAPSVDKIIPALGYVKGNVRVISCRANLLKNNAELWEMEKILEDLRNVYKNLCS